MLVRSKVPAFIDGKLLNIGKDGYTEPYEYKPKEGKKLPSHLKPVGEPEKLVEAPEKGKTKKQIMDELDEAEIAYFPGDKKDILEKLLDDFIKEKAPGNIKPIDKTEI